MDKILKFVQGATCTMEDDHTIVKGSEGTIVFRVHPDGFSFQDELLFIVTKDPWELKVVSDDQTYYSFPLTGEIVSEIHHELLLMQANV